MSRLPNVRLFYIGLATPCSTVVQVLLCLGYWPAGNGAHSLDAVGAFYWYNFAMVHAILYDCALSETPGRALACPGFFYAISY